MGVTSSAQTPRHESSTWKRPPAIVPAWVDTMAGDTLCNRYTYAVNPTMAPNVTRYTHATADAADALAPFFRQGSLSVSQGSSRFLFPFDVRLLGVSAAVGDLTPFLAAVGK